MRKLLARPLTLALCLFGASAQAQTTLLDQQPGGAFAFPAHQGVQAVAEDFTVAKAAGTYPFLLELYGTWTPTGNPVPDTFSVTFHQSNGPTSAGGPGTVVASFSGLTPTLTPTGALMGTPAGQRSEYRVTLTMTTPTLLPPGDYWVEVWSTGSSASGETFQWGMAPTADALRGGPCFSYSPATPGTSWSTCTPLPAKAMAMTLTGLPPRPSLSVTNLVSGALANFRVEDAVAGNPVFLAYSITGPGPQPSPWGPVLLSNPVNILGSPAAGATGTVSINVPIPLGLVGLPVWVQALDVGSTTLSNGLATAIG